MVDLKWEEWLPLEGCIKSDGREMTWFINPTATEKWYLARARRLGEFFNLESIGLFLTQNDARDKAQKLEAAGLGCGDLTQG